MSQISAKIQTCSNLMIQTNSEWIQTDSEEDSDKIQTRFRQDSDRFRCLNLSQFQQRFRHGFRQIQTWIQTDSEDDSDGFRHDFSIRVETINPRGVAKFDPRGMNGTIYVEDR